MVDFFRIAELGYALPAHACVLRAPQVAELATASELIRAAEDHAQSIHRKAEEDYVRELQRGYEDGLRQAGLDAIERLLAEENELNIRLQNLSQDLARVVFDCVRKLVDGFDDEESAIAMFRGALKHMRREKRAELRVSSAVAPGLKGRLESLLAEFPEVELVDVVEDADLEGSRIILETSIGRVDGDMALRLRELEEIIVQAHTAASALVATSGVSRS